MQEEDLRFLLRRQHEGLLDSLLGVDREIGRDKDMVEFHGYSFSRLGSSTPGLERTCCL
jgi:hypothetical protein